MEVTDYMPVWVKHYLKEKENIDFYGLDVDIFNRLNPIFVKAALDYNSGIQSMKSGNQKQANAFWACSASSLFGPSEMCLSISYERGQGVPQDNQKSIKFLRLAAKHEDPQAMGVLGMILFSGRKNNQPFEKNIIEGLQLLQNSASLWFHNPCPASMYNLGLIHYNGIQGVEKNEGMGIHLFQRAAEKGHQGAINALDIIGKNENMIVSTTKTTTFRHDFEEY